MKIKYAVALVIISIFACSLDHENPLDPKTSGIEAPAAIRGLNVALTWQDSVYVTWHPFVQYDGYFLYRSLDENGYFRRLEGIDLEPTDTLYVDTEINTFERKCWYKMSAFTVIEGDTLEGYRCDPKTW
ncbi:MAG TPA: hypothetical protein PLD62_10650 [Candidatus Cloacimonadota bacterium]|nr:hypothetical protein [Candidatus Cloacimonadota bacterium]